MTVVDRKREREFYFPPSPTHTPFSFRANLSLWSAGMVLEDCTFFPIWELCVLWEQASSVGLLHLKSLVMGFNELLWCFSVVVRVCVCVCLRKKESGVCESERDRVCAFVRERVCVLAGTCVSLFVYVSERESVCLCVRLCVWERERERVYV